MGFAPAPRPPPDASDTDPRQIVADTLTDLTNQPARRNDPADRRWGLPITSSHIASTVKQLRRRVTGRQKFWTKPGGDGRLQLRADQLCDTAPLDTDWLRRPNQTTGTRNYTRLTQITAQQKSQSASCARRTLESPVTAVRISWQDDRFCSGGVAQRMPPTHDMDFAGQLKAGNERVLEDLLRAIGPPVRAVLRRKYAGVLSQSDLDDVLAIGLFRLWVARERFDSTKGSLRVWFLRIADNAARDVLRLGWQKARQLETDFDPDFLADQLDRRDASDFGRQADTAPEVVAVREIVAGLPDTQRMIVLADSYSRDGTASSQLLAAELGIPPGTVRVYRKRALDRIRDELKQRGFDPTNDTISSPSSPAGELP